MNKERADMNCCQKDYGKKKNRSWAVQEGIIGKSRKTWKGEDVHRLLQGPRRKKKKKRLKERPLPLSEKKGEDHQRREQAEPQKGRLVRKKGPSHEGHRHSYLRAGLKTSDRGRGHKGGGEERDLCKKICACS